MERIARLMLCLLIATSIRAVAQTNACPVQPLSVKNVASQISVSLQNMSAKHVLSYRVKLTFIDANGKVHSFPHTFVDRGTLKSQGKRTSIWHSPQAQQFLLPVAKAYLLDVTFSDGSQWLDDGTHSCSVTSVQE